MKRSELKPGQVVYITAGMPGYPRRWIKCVVIDPGPLRDTIPYTRIKSHTRPGGQGVALAYEADAWNDDDARVRRWVPTVESLRVIVPEASRDEAVAILEAEEVERKRHTEEQRLAEKDAKERLAASPARGVRYRYATRVISVEGFEPGDLVHTVQMSEAAFRVLLRKTSWR